MSELQFIGQQRIHYPVQLLCQVLQEGSRDKPVPRDVFILSTLLTGRVGKMLGTTQLSDQ